MVLQIFESFPQMSSRSWECVLQTELHLTITATLEGSIICILHVRDLRIRKVCDKSSRIWHLQMMHIYLYCCSVTQSCLILQPHGRSTPGFPVHYLPELAQTHVHCVSDAIQPAHPLPPPFPFAFNLSQYQGVFQWVGSLHHVPQCCSFSFSISSSNEYSGLIFFRIDWLDILVSKGLLRVFSNTAVQKQQFFSA